MIDRQEKLAGETQQVTRAALLMSVGNVSSRVLGLIREMTKSYLFGAGGAVSAFDVALQVPTMFYDQLIGGMLSSALVPVFSDYANPEDREELWHLFAHLLSLVVILLGVLVIGVILAAPWIAQLLGKGFDAEYLSLAAQMIRITALAVLFLNVAGLFSGALYALNSFARPAFTPAIYNAVVVIIMILLGHTALNVRAMALGVLIASIAQVVFQIPGMPEMWKRLRRVNVTTLLTSMSPFPLHPALITIGQLYLPIGLGLLVDQLAVGLSFNLASRTGESGIAWMKYAATLIQFPLGLVVTAVSVAILPTLSRYATEADEAAFRATLAQGLRLVLVLVLPAAVALLVLAEPLVALLLERGEFLPSDTQATAQVLRFSILGLVFAALDQPLIFAFYARKDTWTPALVGVATVLFYIVLALFPTWLHAPRLWELILANSLKLSAHALLMLHLFTRKVGSLRPHAVVRTAGLSLIASVLMAVPLAGMWILTKDLAPPGLGGVFLRLVVSSLVGLSVYLLALRWMGVEDLSLLRDAFRREIKGGKL
ncbi:MAG: murein biosynthesis integral membrane protein MurJ [Anaerolineae bacterium]|nr:murein biosynthesis integral membrane protein MurJ [Anaerolineae bacterium]